MVKLESTHCTKKKIVSRSRNKTKEEQTEENFVRLITQTNQLKEQRSELNLILVTFYNCVCSCLVVSFLCAQPVDAAVGALKVCW